MSLLETIGAWLAALVFVGLGVVGLVIHKAKRNQ